MLVCFSTQKKSAQIVLKTEFAQNNIAEKDISANAGTFLTAFAEEEIHANICMVKLKAVTDVIIQ